MVTLHKAALSGQIIKPTIDKLDYRIIVLDNGLKACVVHDVDTDKAAASMDVRISLIMYHILPLLPPLSPRFSVPARARRLCHSGVVTWQSWATREHASPFPYSRAAVR